MVWGSCHSSAVMATGSSLWLLLLLWTLSHPVVLLSMHLETGGLGLEQAGAGGLPGGRGRVKRGWVWNQFFVVEEYTGTEPLYVGKVKSAELGG